MRFELISSAWKAENLPLIYIRSAVKDQEERDLNPYRWFWKPIFYH